MAAATIATQVVWNLENGVPAAMYDDGTNTWVGMTNGEILKYTNSTGAFVGVVGKINGRIVDMLVYSTHLLVATAGGHVLSFTLSSMAYEGVSLDLGIGIAALAINSTNLKIATNNGNIFKYTIS